ncbi:hypothetical protein FJY69_07710, partial [candidate division WOR-3 bacterium]|nr:hypothetical protein [candidate division WOR-3 bacterium]
MKHAAILVSVLCAIGLAQYDELWQSDEVGLPQSVYVLGIQNTDADPLSELVFISEEPWRDGIVYIWALDLLHGEIEPVTDEFYFIHTESGKEPRLVDVDGNGVFEILFLAQIEPGEYPVWFLYGSAPPVGAAGRKYARLRGPKLGQNTPNPLNKKTRIDFNLPVPGPAAINIFDRSGRTVKRIETGSLDAGQHSVEWQRDDARGVPVP